MIFRVAADLLTAPMREKFSKVFLDRIDDIERDAIAYDSTLSDVCKNARVARAGVYRWRESIPKTIRTIDAMEKGLARIKKRKEVKE